MKQEQKERQIEETLKHQLRRTKIICSINENSNNFELLHQMVSSGANAFSVNMAYLKDRDELKKINEYRNLLEDKFQTQIPLNLILRGTIVRVGNLREPELPLEQRGKRIHLIAARGFVGDSEIIGIDSEEFFENVRPGDKLAIDYGQIVLITQEVIEVSQALAALDRTQDIQLKDRQGTCLVCVSQHQGLLRPYKPINIYEDQQQRSETNIAFVGEADQLTNIDMEDIQHAVRCNFDSITVANTLTPQDIKKARAQIGLEHNHVQVFARIATKVKLETLERILREADGCIVARSYISMNSPVEDIVKYQTQIIDLGRRMLKPVFVSTQILESMLSQTKPSFAEMGDISNVVRQYIDGIILSGETSFGKHPIEVVQTLDRVCKNIERKIVIENLVNEENREHSLINFSGKPVASVIAQSSVEMAHTLQAKAILMLTVTVGTALKISKLRSPCQIVAITNLKHVSRCLNYVNGVTSRLVENFNDQKKLLYGELQSCLKLDLLQKGDFVIILCGSVDESNQWHINQMQVARA